MTTTAQKIAEQFGNDGLRFTSAAGERIEDVCEKLEREINRREGSRRYVFLDRSAITVHGDAWAEGFANCYCWREAGHTDECRAEVRTAVFDAIVGYDGAASVEGWRSMDMVQLEEQARAQAEEVYERAITPSDVQRIVIAVMQYANAEDSNELYLARESLNDD